MGSGAAPEEGVPPTGHSPPCSRVGRADGERHRAIEGRGRSGAGPPCPQVRPRAARAIGGGGSLTPPPSEGEGRGREHGQHRRRSCCPLMWRSRADPGRAAGRGEGGRTPPPPGTPTARAGLHVDDGAGLHVHDGGGGESRRKDEHRNGGGMSNVCGGNVRAAARLHRCGGRRSSGGGLRVERAADFSCVNFSRVNIPFSTTHGGGGGILYKIC